MRTLPPTRASAPAFAVGGAVVLCVGILLSWHPIEDLDIWFHLRAGNDFLEHRAMPKVNSYSFTEPGRPWVNHEWLFQAAAAALGPRAPVADSGFWGWNILRTALCGFAFLLLLLGDGGRQRLRGAGTAAGSAWLCLALLSSLVLLWPRLLLRPELVSYIALIAMVRWAERLRGELSPSAWAFRSSLSFVDPRTVPGRIVWLTWFWAQCHGFSVAAPLLVALGVMLPQQRGAASHPALRVVWRQVLAVVGLQVLALLATPNGWHGLSFLFRVVAQFHGPDAEIRNTIAELVPLLQTSGALGITMAAFKASLLIGGAACVLSWRSIGWLRMILWLASAGLAFGSQRAIGPYAVAYALLLLRTELSLAGVRSTPRSQQLTTASATFGLTATVILGVWWSAAVISDRFYLAEGVSRRFGAGAEPALYPMAAAALLGGSPQQRVFANLGASGLLLGTTDVVLYIDGRTEAYSPALWDEYREIQQGGERALAILESRRVESVCLAMQGGSFRKLALDLAASERWELVLAEGAGLLFAWAPSTTADDSTRQNGAANRKILSSAAQALSSSAASSVTSRTRRADLYLAAATLAGYADDSPTQVASLGAGLRLSPRHPLLNHNLGNQLMAEERFSDALDRFRTAAAVNRRLSGPLLNGGVCLMRLDQPAEASLWFARAAKIDPGSLKAWSNLAVARRASGDLSGARTAVERALALSPGDPRLQNLRNSLSRPPSSQ